ncbi:MAG: hypothetical protein KDK63_00405, partial [Chlamydiia bacterium]|nr:hypothetical protein [Chlamydiia bacterium]
AASKQWLHDHPEHSKFYENMRKLYGETTDSEEKVRIKKILDTHLAEEANQLMLRVSDGAQTVMQAMDNAGIPIPKKMRQGVNMSCAVIQTIASIPQIIFSPYEGAMGVIRGIGQIIGLSRTKQGSFTPEDLRHEQTLSKLHSIETKQLLLLQGQRKIQEMIHQLANNQVKIMQAIQALDTKLYEYMKVVDERFNQVLYNIALIRFGQDTIMKKTLKSAKALRASMENESDFDVEQNRFITYKALEIFSKKVDFLLPTTLQKVFEEVDGPGELEGYFMLGQENSHPYHQHFTALSCFYLKNISRLSSTPERASAALIYSSDTVEKIEKKQARLKTNAFTLPGFPFQDVQLPTLQARGFLEYPYLYPKVEEYTLFALRFHPFYQFFRQGALLPIEKLAETVSNNSLTLLKNMETRLSIALIQQNLLAGDVMLPILYEDYLTNPAAIAKILAPNVILTQNFMIYAFRKHMKSKNRPFIDYHSAFYSRQDDWLLKIVLGDRWTFQWSNEKNRWNVSFENTLHPLPSPSSVINGEVMIPPEIHSLISLKTRIEVEKQKYPEEGKNFGLSPKELEAYLFLLNHQTRPKKQGDATGGSSKL